MQGLHLTYFLLRQLPIPSREMFASSPGFVAASLSDFIVPRVLELTYTAWSLRGLARDLGYSGAPFPWDETKRFIIKCEIDAAYFHVYLSCL